MKMTNKGLYLLFLAGLSIILSVGAVYAVRSGLIDSLGEFKGMYLIAGIVLVYTSLFFCAKAFLDREAPLKGRLLLLFGPGISGGLAGLAGISYWLYPRTIPENLWWIPLMLALLSFLTFQVAFVAAIFILREHWKKS